MNDWKTIAIDPEVLAELRKRVTDFNQTENDVLRGIFALPLKPPKGAPQVVRRDPGLLDNPSDDRVTKLIGMAVPEPPGPRVKYNKHGSVSVYARSGRLCAVMYPQKARLVLNTCKDFAEAIGETSWDNNPLKRGWFVKRDSVDWNIPDGDEPSYTKVSRILRRLWQTVGS